MRREVTANIQTQGREWVGESESVCVCADIICVCRHPTHISAGITLKSHNHSNARRFSHSFWPMLPWLVNAVTLKLISDTSHWFVSPVLAAWAYHTCVNVAAANHSSSVVTVSTIGLSAKDLQMIFLFSLPICPLLPPPQMGEGDWHNITVCFGEWGNVRWIVWV